MYLDDYDDCAAFEPTAEEQAESDRLQRMYDKWKAAQGEGREHEWLMGLSDYDRELVRDWSAAEECHDCAEHADDYGYCRICGAIVSGSLADHIEHGW